MMTKKSVFVSFSFLIAISLLASCGPQKRAPGVKTTKFAGPAAAIGGTVTNQVETVKGSINSVDIKPDSLPVKKGKIVETIQAANSNVLDPKKEDGSETGLVVKLEEVGGSTTVVSIPDKVGESKGSAEVKSDAKTNATSADYKCNDQGKVATLCDNMEIALGMRVQNSNNTIVDKKVNVYRNVIRDANVTRTFVGKEEIHGSAIIETIMVHFDNGDKSEAKLFTNIEIVGADQTKVKKQIKTSIEENNTLLSINVYGLPAYIDDKATVFGNIEVVSKDAEQIVLGVNVKDMGGNFKNLLLKVELKKKFEPSNIKPSAVIAANPAEGDSVLAAQSMGEAEEKARKTEEAEQRKLLQQVP